MRNRPAHVATALALTAALVAGSCSAGGSSAGRHGTTRVGGPTSTTAPTTTTTTRPGQPLPDDVPDETFPGLGDPRIDVRSYDVTVTADPGKATISGRAILELTPTTGPLRSFTLDLRGPKVTRATVAGKAATVTAAQAEITVKPAAPLSAGTEVEVDLTYSGTPDQTRFPALGVPVGWQADDSGGWFTMSEPNGTSTWVPCNDHPSDKASWRITLNTPKGVTGLANGRLQAGSPKAVDGRSRWSWVETEPMAPYLVFAAVGHYDLIQRPVGRARGVFAFPPDLSASKRKGFDIEADILDFYGGLFGAYPDDDAGAIVVDTSLGLALEVQTRPLFGLDGVSDGYSWALAHELAHQWFGDAVTLDNWRDLWLNEGFATYADWLWLDHHGDAPLEASVQDAVSRFADVGLTVRDPTAAGTFDMVVYERGALTLQALRLEVGDATFFKILRTWVARYRGKTASSDDFVALASELAGRKLTSFFASWLDHSPQPSLPG